MSLRETFEARSKEELEKYGRIIVRKMIRYLRDEGKEATGELIRSIGFEVDGFTLTFIAEADHAIYVHEGTDPHWPPPGALEDWVQTVRFAPQLTLQSRDYLARKSIAESGTEATPFMDDVLADNEDIISKGIAQGLLKGLKATLDDTLDRISG